MSIWSTYIFQGDIYAHKFIFLSLGIQYYKNNQFIFICLFIYSFINYCIYLRNDAFSNSH
jgi:hypothetical protein